MKKLLFLLLITPIGVFAQISGTVVNSENKPLPLTNIWVLDGSDGATTDSLGMFYISSALATDTLVFNASGHKIFREEASKTTNVIL